jgi:hypothetical protein
MFTIAGHKRGRRAAGLLPQQRNKQWGRRDAVVSCAVTSEAGDRLVIVVVVAVVPLV